MQEIILSHFKRSREAENFFSISKLDSLIDSFTLEDDLYFFERENLRRKIKDLFFKEKKKVFGYIGGIMGKKILKETILQENEEGIWTYWCYNGQKDSEGNYSSGKQEGIWKCWHIMGKNEGNILKEKKCMKLVEMGGRIDYD